MNQAPEQTAQYQSISQLAGPILLFFIFVPGCSNHAGGEWAGYSHIRDQLRQIGGQPVKEFIVQHQIFFLYRDN